MTDTTASRRSLLTGALGMGAIGVGMLAAEPAAADLGDPTLPTGSTGSFFLKVPGVKGDSKVRGYENQIPSLTWGWGLEQQGDPIDPESAYRAERHLLVVAALVGRQSPLLAQACGTGVGFDLVTLTCVKTGERPFAFLQLELTDTALAGYDVTPHPTSGGVYEVARWRYTSMTYTFTPQKPDGSAGTPVSGDFDFRFQNG